MNDILESDLLRSFVAIVEAGSVTAAAEQVHRTQSAVSMQMKRLEETLGRPLFERSGRNLILTPDGELLLGHARRILSAHRAAIEAFEESSLAGSVTLGTPDEYASTILPKILAQFAQSHPRVHVEVVCENASRTLRKLLANQTVDIALVTPQLDATGGATLVERTPATWVTAAHHWTHEQDPLPLALYPTGCWYRRLAMSLLAEQGRRFRVAYTSVSGAGLLAAIRAGLAVGVLSAHSVPSDLRILTRADGFPQLPEHEIYLQRAAGPPSPLLDTLERHIIASFRSMLPHREVA